MKINYRIKDKIEYKVAQSQSGFVVNFPENDPVAFQKVLKKLEELGFQSGPHFNGVITALGGHLATMRIAWWIQSQHRNDGWVEIPYEQFINSRIKIKNLHREDKL